jgi:branched-chain amino acid transport system substrate-binding protein
VQASGGKVLGASQYPFPGTADFSSFLVQAQSSGAKVIGLCNAGADTVNSIKQIAEFGLNKSMKTAALLMFITDVHALGLDAAGGLNLTESFYWDLNDRTRSFTSRVKAKTPNNWPNMVHAGCYSATLHYLKTVHAMGAAEAKKDGVATVNAMKKMPVDDDCFGKTTIREDGRNLTPAFLFEVKKPAESKGPWDYYKLMASAKGEDVYRPLADGHCPFIKA